MKILSKIKPINGADFKIADAKDIAIGDSDVEEKINTIYLQTQGFVSLALYSNLVQNNDWTNAIRTALSECKNVLIPSGTYYINDTIELSDSMHLIGCGRGTTKIIGKFKEKPLFKIYGGNIKLSSLSLYRDSSLTIEGNIGIECGDGHSFLTRSIIEDLEIINQNVGIYCPPGTNVYSCTFRDININGYIKGAIYLEPDGSTGCIFDNIYTTNWDDYSSVKKYTAKFGIFLKNYSECNLRQINIEHSILEYGMYINSCDTINIENLHVEGYEQTGKYNGIIAVDNSSLEIKNISISFSSTLLDRQTLQSADLDWNIFKINQSKVKCNRIFNRDNFKLERAGTIIKNGTTALAYNVTKPNKKDTVDFCLETWINKDNLFKNLTAFTLKSDGKTHQISNINGEQFYENKNGCIYNYTLKSVPTSGEWEIGDRVLNVNNDYADYICTSTGFFPPKKTAITATGKQWQSGLVLSTNDDLKKGYGIILEGDPQVYTITEIWGGGCNVTPVLQTANITNSLLTIASPIFKGIGKINN